jgi:hypothetical protein
MTLPGGVTSGIPIYTPVVGTGADQAALAANNLRRGLLFHNPSATVVFYLMPQPLTGSVAAALNTGIQMPVGSTVIIDDLFCTCAWRVISSAAGGSLTCLEWQ